MSVQLNAGESALFLLQLARKELYDKSDLRSQLACLRVEKAIEAIEGNVDMEAYEAKVLGNESDG